MRLVIQRVSRASVKIGDTTKASIGKGLLVLLGVDQDDGTEDLETAVRKTAGMRLFDDEDGIMNLSVQDVEGDVLVISQFTLLASCKKGNRPSYIRAAGHETAIPLYEEFCKRLSESIGKAVGTGEFGADMKIDLCNDGPVTIFLDTHNL